MTCFQNIICNFMVFNIILHAGIRLNQALHAGIGLNQALHAGIRLNQAKEVSLYVQLNSSSFTSIILISNTTTNILLLSHSHIVKYKHISNNIIIISIYCSQKKWLIQKHVTKLIVCNTTLYRYIVFLMCIHFYELSYINTSLIIFL